MEENTMSEQLLQQRKARMRRLLDLQAPDDIIYQEAKLIVEAYEALNPTGLSSGILEPTGQPLCTNPTPNQ